MPPESAAQYPAVEEALETPICFMTTFVCVCRTRQNL